MSKKLYQELSSLLTAYQNCEKSGNTEWAENHSSRIDSLVSEHMPSGSGFDSGTKFNWEESKPERLVFDSAYHCMNDGGYYDGWIAIKAIVKPSLAFGYDLRIQCRSRRGYDDSSYFHESFDYSLCMEV